MSRTSGLAALVTATLLAGGLAACGSDTADAGSAPASVARPVASARAAYGLRLPAPWSVAPALPAGLRGEVARAAGVVREPAAASADRSRAVMVADAVAATQRRESAPIVAGAFAAPASSSHSW